MARKLTAFDRRELLKARERGLTDSEIKAQFGIRDDRTLKRHLRLAEQEQDARLAKTEILKEALGDHLAELRMLIERWEDSIRTEFSTTSSPAMAPVQSLQSTRLFGSLRSHLPFPILWRQYSDWEAKCQQYMTCYEKLQYEIRERAREKMELDFASGDSEVSSLSPDFSDWVLRHVRFRLEEKADAAGLNLEFHWRVHQVSVHGDVVETNCLYVVSDTKQGRYTEIEVLRLVGEDRAAPEHYEAGCQEILASCLQSDTVRALVTSFRDIRNLETTLRNHLEEIRLRRDYILYTCDLCPGQPRLPR